MPQPTWVTPAGNFGTYTEGVLLTQTFSATASSPWHVLYYNLLNGVLPSGFTLNDVFGVLSGTPGQVATTTEYQFTIRVNEYYGTTFIGFSDRTFSFSVEGITPPSFVTPSGPLYPGPTYLPDSTWDPFQIVVSNPDPDTTTVVRLVDGVLPGGLEINDSGLIRGYADQISDTYNFTLEVAGESGTDLRNFSIQVVQQSAMNRAPGILNTRPPSYNIDNTDPHYPFYLDSTGNIGVLSQDNYFIFRVLGDSFSSGSISYSRTGTLPPGVSDNINYNSTNVEFVVVNGGSGYIVGNQLRILGSAVGGVDTINDITFQVSAVSGGAITAVNNISGLNVDSDIEYNNVAVQTVTGIGAGAVFDVSKINAGWIMGTISINSALTVETYSFTYTAINNVNSLTSDPINFSMIVVSQTDNVPFNTEIEWISSSDLGSINNGTVSVFEVEAINLGGLPLEYSIISGSLPNDLTLNSDGTISGTVAWELDFSPTPIGTDTTYTFTVRAQNATYPELTSDKTFTITVHQQFDQPYDNIYIRSYFDISDRLKLDSLLQDENLIPQNYLYRPMDPNFGKATDVVYQHMYGVPSSLIQDYISAVTKNHYRRNLVLGPLKTAQAKSGGVVIYEVVYSEIIDNLVNNDGISVSKSIIWPFQIDGLTRTVYPASLDNMRQQIADTIGQDTQSALLPAWMSSQQEDGNVLGFKPVWVICYCKPGYAEEVKNNIVSPFPDQITIISSSSTSNTFKVASTEGFYPGMRIKFSGAGFGGVTIGVIYLVFNIESETEFSITTSMSTYAIPLTTGTGEMYMEHFDWLYTLNELNFKIDRFEVGKSLTYDYNPATQAWTVLPSGVDTTDSNDQYVFWKKNILSSDS